MVTLQGSAAAFTPGVLLTLLHGSSGSTRADLVGATGISRVAINQRLGLLLDADLVVTDGLEDVSRGRPPVRYRFNPQAGIVLSVDVGISATRVAVADLSGEILADAVGEVNVSDGPDAVLLVVEKLVQEALAAAGQVEQDLWGVGVGVPGPVEFQAGRVISPPVMTGWDHFPIRDWFSERYQCPVVVDKDANVMALGEHRAVWPDVQHMLFVKAGTGVGCGVIIDGRIYRGANGAAGDVGHIRVEGHGATICRCGQTGCVEALAGGWALVRDLQAAGVSVSTAADVARLAQLHDHLALSAIRQAGQFVGEALADAVNFFNPSLVVVGGAIGMSHGEFLAGLRQVIYERSLPLSTQDLEIRPSVLQARAGVVGAAHLISELLLAPLAVDERLERSLPAQPALPRL